MRTLTLLTIVSAVASMAASQPGDEKPAYDPIEDYTELEIEGWKVLVNKRLMDDGGKVDLRDRTLRHLEVHLYNIVRQVPEEAVAELRKIAIWVEAGSEQFPCMCYHVSEDWLRENGVNPKKAGAVELANPESFLTWTREQPWMVLHELAHGYHHQVLKYGNESVAEGYKRAKESGIYESVLHWDGNMVRAYAMNNDTEYFAELSEAFFGTNDFYPFVRVELEKHDPWMYEKMVELWKGKPRDSRDQ